MLVMVLMAIIVSSISFSFDVQSPKDKTFKEAKRFQAIYHLAAEYALLNNVQFGIVIKEQGYEFVGFDGERWTPISDETYFAEYELEEFFRLELRMDDIPWLDEQANEDEGLFETSNDEEEEEDKIVPQLYLFSSGDISPFELVIIYEEDFSDDDPVGYSVTGEYTIPLKVEGPLEL